MNTLNECLAHGDVVIMDGGVSTEIQQRGVALDSHVWSGTAHRDHPDIARRVHEDYIRVGAQVITANTFGTARHVLESVGIGDEFEAINRLAVAIAKEARDSAADGEVWIAGSISSMPPLTEVQTTARGPNVEANYRDQAEILADAGADVLVLEMMGDTEGAAPVIRAASTVGLPVWVGFSMSSTSDGRLIGYRTENENLGMPVEDFGAMADTLLAIGGDAAGIMHSAVADTGPGLQMLAQRWNGPLLAYAETGKFMNPEWNFEQVVSPDDYAAEVERWVNDHGVQIVGGCCGTGPEHIRLLKERLPARLPGG
jgi:S-methylmethionine-dependent homocysteine/selenocysteine methylase